MRSDTTGSGRRGDDDQTAKSPPNVGRALAGDGLTSRSFLFGRRGRARGGARRRGRRLRLRGLGRENGLLEVLLVEQRAVEVQRLPVEEDGRRAGHLAGLLRVVRHAVDLGLLLVALD